jgi:hypothetical protein
VFAIELFRGTEVHRHAVLHYFVVLQDLVENLDGPATIDHEILGDNFEPVAGGFAAEDVVVVGNAQADAYAAGGEIVKAICGHAGSKAQSGIGNQ